MEIFTSTETIVRTSLHGGSLEFALTVPLRDMFMFSGKGLFISCYILYFSLLARLE